MRELVSLASAQADGGLAADALATLNEARTVYEDLPKVKREDASIEGLLRAYVESGHGDVALEWMRTHKWFDRTRQDFHVLELLKIAVDP